MSPSTAHKFMEDAGGVSNRTMSTDSNHGHSEGAYNPDAPPPRDEDAPREADEQATTVDEVEIDRVSQSGT